MGGFNLEIDMKLQSKCDEVFLMGTLASRNMYKPHSHETYSTDEKSSKTLFIPSETGLRKTLRIVVLDCELKHLYFHGIPPY